MNFNKMIPELSVFDIDQTIEFYKSLGFELIYERPEEKDQKTDLPFCLLKEVSSCLSSCTQMVGIQEKCVIR